MAHSTIAQAQNTGERPLKASASLPAGNAPTAARHNADIAAGSGGIRTTVLYSSVLSGMQGRGDLGPDRDKTCMVSTLQRQPDSALFQSEGQVINIDMACSPGDLT